MKLSQPNTVENLRVAWGKIHTFSIIGLCFAVITVLFYTLPIGKDWNIFAAIDWREPFANPLYFNPPWLGAVAPWVLLPDNLGAAVNRSVMLFVFAGWLWKHNADRFSFVIVFTSSVFLSLVKFNNIDYLILIAFMIPAEYGLLILAIKPQVAAGAGLIWLKQKRLRLLGPLVAVVIGSLVVWGFWPLAAFNNIGMLGGARWNMAPWPIGIIPGAYLLYRAWGDNDVLLAAVSTPLMMPYINSTTIAIPLAILAVREDKQPAWMVYWGCWFLSFIG